MTLLHSLDLLSTFVFALVGARVAADKGLDYGATMSGVQLAVEMNITWFAAILLGVITAVTGGLLRDVLCQLEPVLLHRETIGTSSLMGAVTFVALNQVEGSLSLAAIIGGLVVILTRVISIQFDLHLPRFNK